MLAIEDHPLREALANELHARPFPFVEAPANAVYLAVKPPPEAAAQDRDADRAHLIALLDRFGARHPEPLATHYSGKIGAHHIKWECHTEFVTYTIFGPDVAQTPFNGATFNLLPDDWLAELPGVRVTSALIRVEKLYDKTDIVEKTKDWFVPESLAISRVLDDNKPGRIVTSSDWSLLSFMNFNFAPVLSATICHGTRLLWCSITLRMISSPGLRLWSAQELATRLMASVAFRVKTTWSGELEPINWATLARDSSTCSADFVTKSLAHESLCSAAFLFL